MIAGLIGRQHAFVFLSRQPGHGGDCGSRKPKNEDLTPGFPKQVTFLGDDETGEYGSISLWDSEAALTTYREQAAPQLAAALQDVALGPPTIRKFEVYEPKA